MNRTLSLLARHLPVFCFALVATSSWSAPVHAHCKEETWTLSYTADITGEPDMEAGFSIIPATPIPPPTPGGNDDPCKYELSDFSRVDLTLTFSGPTLLTSNPFSVANNYYSTTSTNSTGPPTTLYAAFMSGVETTLLFAQHTSGGYISGLGTDESPLMVSTVETSLTFPANSISVQYTLRSDPGAEYTISGASIKLTGKHYFRGVPAPGSILLVAIGLVGMVLTHTFGRARSIVYPRATTSAATNS